MHIPDGYISPASAVALYGAAAPFWWLAGQRLKRLLTGQTVPLLALFSAFSFTIMMFNVPVPGGTTAHAIGGTLAAIVAGPWAAVITVSVALIIQAVFFGDGGIMAIGANCFNLGVALPFAGYGVYSLLSRGAAPLSRRRVVAAAIGAYVGANVAGFLVALELGVQPLLWSEGGRALYFPYSFNVTIPALMFSHLTVAGAAEALATAFALSYVQRAHPQLLLPRSAPQPAAPRSKKGLTVAALLTMVALVPLGLLASGGVWGEWSTAELEARLGYVPAGVQRFESFGESVWSAPFSGYTVPWISADASFAEQALAYILSAVIGIGLIIVATFVLRIRARRQAEGHASSQPRRGAGWSP